MSFLHRAGEKIADAELYELSGDEDDRLRQEYELVICFQFQRNKCQASETFFSEFQ